LNNPKEDRTQVRRWAEHLFYQLSNARKHALADSTYLMMIDEALKLPQSLRDLYGMTNSWLKEREAVLR
jgi:hypothetical protein